jgi:uncharacterized protein (UPF0210 family)
MKVRAVTGFLDPGWPLDEGRVASLAGILHAAQQALGATGREVQSLRLATPAPSKMSSPVLPPERAEFARQLAARGAAQGVDYVSIGPALPEELPGFSVIPEVLSTSESVFCNGVFARRDGGLSLEAAAACAEVIRRSAALGKDGFANLRFAALAAVAPGTPFFPAAYHAGGPPHFAIATEAADLPIEAFGGAETLEQGCRRLVELIESEGARLAGAVQPVAEQHKIEFSGIDFSLAPFPEAMRSVGTALESMGLPAVGWAGSVAAVALLVRCLEQARFPHTGFCGVMLPILEDAVLAKRAAEGRLRIADLLLYATLCGTGLDTIPLPGDATSGQLTSLLVDLGVLALRHAKPLTARLMPIPGKQAGDAVHFDFPYFAAGRVMELPAAPLEGLLGQATNLQIGRTGQHGEVPRKAPICE